MVMYGKKNRSLLPSLSGLRGSAASQKSEKITEAIKNKCSSSSANASAINDTSSSPFVHSQDDDTIDELASMLLDDTILEEDQPRIEPVRSLPCRSSAQTMPLLSNAAANGNKSLPRLPNLIFNGDDAWAMMGAPVVTADGHRNETHFEQEDKNPLHPSTRSVHHVRQGSGPPLPRKSSRRQSARPKIAAPKPPPSTDMMNASFQDDLGYKASSVSTGDEINKKIQAMLAANQALKSAQKVDNSPTRGDGASFPSKKRRLKENNVLAKMKSAISGRFPERGARTRQGSALLDPLLDNASNYAPDCGAESVSSTETRTNEGFNLRNEKVKTDIGHGYIGRKPVVDGSRSLYRKISSAALSPENPQSPGLTRTSKIHGSMLNATFASEKRVGTDFPSQTTSRGPMAQSESRQYSLSLGASDDDSSLHSLDLPIHVKTPNNHVRRAKKTTNLNYEGDLDAVFTSSPLGHSTPRIRLEPTEDEGRRMLKRVPAETRSIFDSEIAMNIDHFAANSHRGPIPSNRTKKHPSPSKRELEELEYALGQIEGFPKPAPDSFKALGSSEDFTRRLAPSSVLGGAAVNTSIKGRKVLRRSKLVTQNSLKTRSTESMPLLSRSKQHKANSRHDELMDVDELQWDDSQYNIGMKRD